MRRANKGDVAGMVALTLLCRSVAPRVQEELTEGVVALLEAQYRTFLDHEQTALWVVENKEGRIVGGLHAIIYLETWSGQRCATVQGIAVMPEYAAAARKLIRLYREWAELKRVQTAYITVSSELKDPRRIGRLLKLLGFRYVGGVYVNGRHGRLGLQQESIE